ncbi:MAG: trypsin-like peptidase domain-containing protein [Candidatus Brocadiia bacterium]
MGLTIRFQGGARAGEVLDFGDQVETVVFGRDADRCQVVFPPDETKVGREHCALRRVLGRYRLQLNKDNLVLLDGKPAMEDQELGATADLQLGPDGPRLIAETTGKAGLLPTMDQGRRVGQATMVRDAGRTARKGRNLALAVAALLVVFGVVVLIVARRQEEKIRSVAELTRADKALINDMAGKLATVAARSEALPMALAKARPSVYMVVLRFQPEGKSSYEEVQLGTAWVIADGVLATNAHVAEVFNNLGKTMEDLKPLGILQEYVVRSDAPEPKTHRIKSVRIHPGYEEFQKIWGELKPGYGQSLRTLRIVDAAGPACDVGLLQVDEADQAGLAEKLPVATPKELGELLAGRSVGYVGYPGENLALISQTHPNPVTQVGSITAVTDFLGVSSKDGQLIQNSLPLAGGASGSPVLNADGHVIAILSAGNMVVTSSGRTPSAAGINFAQRVDLVTELLEGRAEKAQPERSAAWRRQIPEVYDTGLALLHKDLVPEYMKYRAVQLAGDDEDVEVQAREISHQAGTLTASAEAANPATYKVTATLPLNAVCLVAVASSDDSCDLALNVVEKGGAGAGQEHPGQKIHGEVPWASVTQFEARDAEPIEITASASSANAPVDVYVYEIEKKEPTPEKRLGKVLASWVNDLKQSKGGEFSTEEVIAQQAELGEPTAELKTPIYKTDLNIAGEGHYMAVAVGSPGQNVAILVAAVNGDERTELAKDTRDLPCTACAFDAEGKLKTEIYVLGQTAKTRFDLWVYRAVPRTP